MATPSLRWWLCVLLSTLAAINSAAISQKLKADWLLAPMIMALLGAGVALAVIVVMGTCGSERRR